VHVPVPTAQQKIRFGAFELDRQTAELYKHGTKLKLQGQPIAVLALLLERPGDLVTREELRKHLCPEDTFVDFEHSLNTHIKKLRQVLNDDAETPRFIETLPRRGYRFIAQVEAVQNGSGMAEDVGKLAADTEADSRKPTPLPEPSPTPLPRPPPWKYAVAALLGCALLIASYSIAAPRIARLIWLYQLQQLAAVPLTELSGNVASPTFSPDGSQIAFAWDGENNGAGFDLYVKTIGTDQPLRLTHHPARWLSAAWSHDGRSIAISRAAEEIDSGIFLVPPTGGPERKVASRGVWSAWGNEISWSPDGKYLAYTDQPENPKSNITVWLFMLRLDTLDRTVVETGCDTVFTPSFSPTGDYLAWACRETPPTVSVNARRLSDGRTLRLAKIGADVEGMAWSGDGRRIIFSAGSGELLEVSLARPYDPQRLPIGHDATDIAVSPSGHRLAYVQGVSITNIWRLDLLASPPKASKLVKLAMSTWRQTPTGISPDGKRIAFESSRTGLVQVWICDADGSNASQLTYFGTSDAGSPRWSPDGKLIAFDSRIGGEANIYIVDPAGGPPRKIEIDNARGNSTPSWSGDGKWIYFDNGDDAAKQSVWKVPVTGGHAVQLAQAHAAYPLESPDGQYVYFVRDKRLWRVRTDGSAEQVVRGMPELNYLGDEWFPSGSGIYFMSHSGDKAAIEFFDMSTEKVHRVYDLEEPLPLWIGGMPVSSDGKWLLFPQVDQQSGNLMVIENWH
jgi:Tol biopolymer transport system component/DNA-binding winged helix-turn-helix (wHTH) protein